jgi:hypothetical protein
MKPTIGRIVYFRIGGTDADPELRPGTVVRVWSPDCVNLQVDFDGENDKKFPPPIGPDTDEASRGRGWRKSVSEGDGVGEWRWPPREPADSKKPTKADAKAAEAEKAKAVAEAVVPPDVARKIDELVAADKPSDDSIPS